MIMLNDFTYCALLIEDVTKTFSKGKSVVRAVNEIDLQVDKNEIFGLLGPNGSGKSTLIRIISTLLIPDKGRVEIFGHDTIRESRYVQRIINRVSVEASFFKKLSVMENLLFTAGVYGLSQAEAKKKLYEIFERVKLPKKRLTEPMENFSRGMQQKVAIARAFLTSPIMMLLDEPTTGLDPRAKREVQRLIKEIVQEHDATVFLTTHDMKEAEQLCDRIGIIHNGEIVALDTPENLKKKVGARNMEEVFMAFTGMRFEGYETAEVI